MPIYQWKRKGTDETVEVVRSVSDIDVPPTEDELQAANMADVVDPAELERVLCARIVVTKSNAWGFGKGYHNNQTPSGGRQVPKRKVW